MIGNLSEELKKLIGDVPFGAFGFTVRIDGTDILGCFQEVTGLGIKLDVEDVPEGGVNSTKRKMIKGASYTNVTLKRGMCGPGMYAWITAALTGIKARSEVTISMLDDDAKSVRMVYHLRRAIPISWAGPALNVMSDAIATESIELAHEGLVVGGA